MSPGDADDVAASLSPRPAPHSPPSDTDSAAVHASTASRPAEDDLAKSSDGPDAASDNHTSLIAAAGRPPFTPTSDGHYSSKKAREKDMGPKKTNESHLYASRLSKNLHEKFTPQSSLAYAHGGEALPLYMERVWVEVCAF